DEPRLMALCRRLSPRTEYQRFFSVRRLLPEEAHAFANVDYRQRMAVVLVNNAGSVVHAGPLHETADEIWDGDGRVLQGRVPLLTGGDPSHAAAGRRLDRQHRLGPRAEGLPGFSRPPVRRGEGGRGHAHENDRRALREGRDPL